MGWRHSLLAQSLLGNLAALGADDIAGRRQAIPGPPLRRVFRDVRAGSPALYYGDDEEGAEADVL